MCTMVLLQSWSSKVIRVVVRYECESTATSLLLMAGKQQ